MLLLFPPPFQSLSRPKHAGTWPVIRLARSSSFSSSSSSRATAPSQTLVTNRRLSPLSAGHAGSRAPAKETGADKNQVVISVRKSCNQAARREAVWAIHSQPQSRPSSAVAGGPSAVEDLQQLPPLYDMSLLLYHCYIRDDLMLEVDLNLHIRSSSIRLVVG